MDKTALKKQPLNKIALGHLLKKIASTVNIISGLEFRGLFKKKVVGTFLLFLGEVRLGYMAGGPSG